MRTERILGLEDGRGAGAVSGPVDLGILQVEEVYLVNGRLLVPEGFFGVLAPVIGGGDDDALGEGLAAGGGEEAVDVGLAHAVVGGEALALDGVVFLGAPGLGDEVDAGVLRGSAELRGADFLGPVGEEPDVVVEILLAGLVAEVGADELLEVGAFFPFGPGGVAVLGEDALQGSHGVLDGETLGRGA